MGPRSIARGVRIRSAGWDGAFDALRRDVAYAVRMLRRSPAFTTIAVITLALGIGANTAMFSVVNAVMLRPLPYRDADRLALIWTDDAKRGLHQEATAYRTITDWQRDVREFQDIAFFSTNRAATMTNNPTSERQRTRSALVSANFFSLLGVPALRGRLLSAGDDESGDPVIVISYGMWQRRFAVVLAAVACAACYVPARRATRLDPVRALRQE